jgi:hypothetical protein
MRSDPGVFAGIEGIVDQFLEHDQRPVVCSVADLGLQVLLGEKVEQSACSERRARACRCPALGRFLSVRSASSLTLASDLITAPASLRRLPVAPLLEQLHKITQSVRCLVHEQSRPHDEEDRHLAVALADDGFELAERLPQGDDAVEDGVGHGFAFGKFFRPPVLPATIGYISTGQPPET